MKSSVYVSGREVASIEQMGHFQSRLIYHPNAGTDDFVSLTMHVQREPWTWDEPLPPVFQMNLPEGYLLQVLQEQFGPHIGADPLALLSVVGRNMIGRVQVAPPGADLDTPLAPIDVAALLQGDNSADAFARLVQERAASGVSGVVPKFLDNAQEYVDLGRHEKGTLLTHRHIIKGSSPHLPFVSLNEHLCMQVAAKVIPTATTQISLDGQALVVDRFDVDAQGRCHYGMEDFCALLGLRPANKYQTTWERIAKAVRDHVPGGNRATVQRQLAVTVLLTHALRNADCHAKNVALLYTGRADVHLAPVYDMLTTAAYPQYAMNPPAIHLAGRKTWEPGKTLQREITKVFGVSAVEQTRIIEQIGAAIADIAPQVRVAMQQHPGFHEIGTRMLLAWQEGMRVLRSRQVYALPPLDLGEGFKGLSEPEPVPITRDVIGRSDLVNVDPLK